MLLCCYGVLKKLPGFLFSQPFYLFSVCIKKPFFILKYLFMRRYMFQSLAILFAATIWVSCKKDDNNNTTPTEDTFKLSGNASGAQERPAVTTTNATATLTGTYHTENKMLDYTITWTGLSAPAANMHFHGPAATPDSSAGVQVAITDFPTETSGTVSGMATLTAEQESQLLGGKWYYNIHTSNHQAGEIRGNITATHD